MQSFPRPDHHHYGPDPKPALLIQWLTQANTLTRSILQNMAPGNEKVPQLNSVNPPYWEFGHLTWFHEFWVQRQGKETNTSRLTNADQWFNSTFIQHTNRWTTPFPHINVLLEYNAQVIEQTLSLLQQPQSSEILYFIQLAIFHQDMHNEAFAYTWQTLGYPAPFEPFHSDVFLTETDSFNRRQTAQRKEQLSTYIDFPASSFEAGSRPDSGFIFDNEKWLHTLDMPSFSIARQAVSNAEYLEFIESAQSGSHPLALLPKHWKKEDVWMQRYFNQWVTLDLSAPVRHISYWDAQQYCVWRGVRLPTEHELTQLMYLDQHQWVASQLWEWSSSLFLPFPGFTSDPYEEYSKPWFDGNYQVLKGGSSYTPERLRRPSFRNFYTPTRADHFCGFRTCLL